MALTFSTRQTFLPGGGSPLSVRARQQGGYDEVGVPNVNNPVDVYKMQTGATNGQHTAPQFGNQPALENRLSENLDLQARADAFNQQTADQERIERRSGSMINPYLKERRWSALFQALSEAGADKLQTGAKAGYGGPGFFDTQSTMGAPQQQRANYMGALMANLYEGKGQGR